MQFGGQVSADGFARGDLRSEGRDAHDLLLNAADEGGSLGAAAGRSERGVQRGGRHAGESPGLRWLRVVLNGYVCCVKRATVLALQCGIGDDPVRPARHPPVALAEDLHDRGKVSLRWMPRNRSSRAARTRAP